MLTRPTITNARPPKKTGHIREVLCSKKAGDMLWVPTVEQVNLIHELD